MVKKIKWVGTLSTTERNNIGLIKVRQNNVNSEVLGFNIVDGNGEPYDLKNRKVLFCTYFDRFAPVEQYAEVIENGKIVYTMNEHDMQKPVRINFAYFKIMDEKDNLVDTTQNFSYDIMPSIESKCMNSEPYIVRLEEVLDAFLQINSDAKKELEQIIMDFNEQVIKQQQDFEFWFESIKDILESIDPGGILLGEIVDFRYSKTFNKQFDNIKDRGEFWDQNFNDRGGNPKNYGAKFDGVTDDTIAIKTCVNKHSRIILPPGTAIITDSIDLTDKHVIGSQRQATRLLMKTSDASKAILLIGRHTSIESFQIGFDETLISDNVSEGDFSALKLSSTEHTLVRGRIKDFLIDGCGTGIYAPASTFSSSFEDITIFNARYRYLHFSGPTRTGNIYSNIYMSEHGKNKFISDCGVYFSGEESDGIVSQFNIEHMKVKNAIIFENCRAMTVNSIHLEGVDASESEFKFINSNINFGGLTVYFSRGLKSNQSMFLFGESNNPKGLTNSQCTVIINSLFFKGLNRPDSNIYNSTDYPYNERTLRGEGVAGYSFARRENGVSEESDYLLKINSYDWITWTNTFNDNNEYKYFKKEGNVSISFGMYSNIEKSSKNVYISSPVYYSNVLAKTVGVIGKEIKVDLDRSIKSPKTINYDKNIAFAVNSVEKRWNGKTVLGFKNFKDYLDLVSGDYLKVVEKIQLDEANNYIVQGNQIQINLGFKPLRSVNDSISYSTHFPKEHYNTNFSALYLSKSHLIDNNILGESDTNETISSKIKNWTKSQKEDGTPVEFLVIREEPSIEKITKENFILNTDLSITTSSVSFEAYACVDI